MQSKFFTSPLAAVAAAMAMMTAPVATTTMSVATVVTPAVASVAVAVVAFTPAEAQAGRRDGNRVDPSAVAFDYDWDMLLVDEDGFEVLDEG